MESPEEQQSPQTKNHKVSGMLILLVTRLLIVVRVGCGSTHIPVSQTWEVIDTATGQVINSTTQTQPLGTWWPDLFFRPL